MSNQQKDPEEFNVRLSLRLSCEIFCLSTQFNFIFKHKFKKARKQIILKRNFDFHLCPTQITC